MLYPEEDSIALASAHEVASILAAFDAMSTPQLRVLADGGRLLDDLGIDLWRATRPYPAVDDFFCALENKTRTIASQHHALGAITGDQVFLCALAVQAAAVSILLAAHNPQETTELLASAWSRATRA